MANDQRGHELKYAIYVSDKDMGRSEAIEFLNDFFKRTFGRYCEKMNEITDWDGPL